MLYDIIEEIFESSILFRRKINLVEGKCELQIKHVILHTRKDTAHTSIILKPDYKVIRLFLNDISFRQSQTNIDILSLCKR